MSKRKKRIPGPQATSRSKNIAQLHSRLGWEDTAELPKPKGTSSVVVGFISDQPAAVFAVTRGNPINALAESARLAYHSSIEWGIVSGRGNAILFNALRRTGDNWYSLPSVPTDRLERSKAPISFLTPESLRDGTVEEKAFAASPPDANLFPVDDVLVDCLDSWRDEALRYAEKKDGIDEKIQTLFSQLFILRCVEDRGLIPNLPALRTTLTDSSVSKRDLKRVFTRARKEIQSELFSERVIDDLPIDVVAGVIRDLYKPSSMPIRDFTYNFAWINSDILGRAYQKYLSDVLSPERISDPQQRLFSQPRRDVKRLSVRKAGGVFYTPEFIVRYLTAKCIDGYLSSYVSTGHDIDKNLRLPTVADPACGSGSFLVAAVHTLLDRLKQIDKKRNWARELVESKCIVGLDIDPRAVTLSRLAVWLRLTEEFDPLPLPDLHDSIRSGDSLRPMTWKGLPEKIDVFVGNPPFVASLSPEERDSLASRFATARGRIDLAYVFLELACIKLGDNGHLGFVMPNRLFTSRDAGSLRSHLSEECQLLSVVDFGSNEVFVGTNSYIGLITVRRRLPSEPHTPFRFIRVMRLPDRFPAWMIDRAERQHGTYRNECVSAYDVDHPAGQDRWLFLSPSEKAARVELEGSGPTLGELANLPQGIKTGANDIFVVSLLGKPVGGQVQIRNGFGDTHWIETRLLKPVVFGSDIQRYAVINPERYLIYPYLDGAHISPTAMKKIAPNTLAYFNHYRELLNKRSSTSTRGKGWYELAEKRDVRWLESKKLLIRELAPEPSFAVDAASSTYLIGGTAVVPSDESLLLPLLAFLNSQLSRWYLSHRTPEFRSSFQKYEPEALSGIPVPRKLLVDTDVQLTLAELTEQLLDAKQQEKDRLVEQLEADIELVMHKRLGFSLPENL